MEQFSLGLKASLSGYLSLFYCCALLIILLSSISLIFTMIIKKIYTHLEYSYYEKIIFPFIAPGIIIHEFSHLLIGLMVGLKPKKIKFFEIKSGTGYVQFSNSPYKNPLLYLDMIIAPFIIGTFLINVLFLEITSRNSNFVLKFFMIWLLLGIISAILPSRQDLSLAIKLVSKQKVNIFGLILGFFLSFIISLLIIGIDLKFFIKYPAAFLLCILIIQVITLRIFSSIINQWSKSSGKRSNKKMENTSILQKIEDFPNHCAPDLNWKKKFVDLLEYARKPGKDKEEKL